VTRDFEEWVNTLHAALRQFKLDRDCRSLYGDAIEDAISGICNSDPARPSHHKKMFIVGLQAVGLLLYTRYRSAPTRSARFLWGAADLFRIIRPAPFMEVLIPDELARLLDVLAADDLEMAQIDGLDDPALAFDTAILLAEYATVQQDIKALRAAESLIRRVLACADRPGPQQAAHLNNLINVLMLRYQWTGANLVDEIVTLVDLAGDTVDRTDPMWPDLQATAGGACYTAAVRTEDLVLLDRGIALLDAAVTRMPDDWAGKAGFLENLGRAELIRWAWTDEPTMLSRALASLRRSVGSTHITRKPLTGRSPSSRTPTAARQHRLRQATTSASPTRYGSDGNRGTTCPTSTKSSPA
jgi:hypothetical protein